jgi:hypothetical protein
LKSGYDIDGGRDGGDGGRGWLMKVKRRKGNRKRLVGST